MGRIDSHDILEFVIYLAEHLVRLNNRDDVFMNETVKL